MRYMLIHTIDESAPEASNPSPEFMEGMGRFMGEVAQAGALLAAEGVQHSSTGARIRHSGGTNTVTDGPFTEAREVIGGFAIIEVKSREEALEWAGRFADLFEEVQVEVRRIVEFSDLPDGGAHITENR